MKLNLAGVGAIRRGENEILKAEILNEEVQRLRG